MLSAPALTSCESELGVPLTFAPTAAGVLMTHSAAHAVARGQQPDIASGQHVIRETLENRGIPVVLHGDSLQVDPTESTRWLLELDLDWGAVTERVHNFPPAAYLTAGHDNAVWAWLLMARAGTEVSFGNQSAAWASRTDANPLSLVRRAHARVVIHTQWFDADAARPHVADATLRAQLALAPQLAAQASRTFRTRQLIEHIGRVASAALTHLEQEPAERTDLHALEAARRLIHNALRAADLNAPVPF